VGGGQIPAHFPFSNRFRSAAFQVGDYSAGDTDDVCRRRAEVVVPRSCSGPHLVVLQQVRIDKDTQLRAVPKGRHATSGIGNLNTLSCYLAPRRGRETSLPSQFGQRCDISDPHATQNVHSKLQITASPASARVVLHRSHTARISNMVLALLRPETVNESLVFVEQPAFA